MMKLAIMITFIFLVLVTLSLIMYTLFTVIKRTE